MSLEFVHVGTLTPPDVTKRNVRCTAEPSLDDCRKRPVFAAVAIILRRVDENLDEIRVVRRRVHERPTASELTASDEKMRRRLHRRSPSGIERCIVAHEAVDQRADASVFPARRAWRP